MESSAEVYVATLVKRDLEWTEDMQKAFEDLKNKLTTPQVLAYPDFETPFIVEIDASSVVIEVVPAQKKEDGKVHPVQYASRRLTEQERRYYTSKREALAWNLYRRNFECICPRTSYLSFNQTIKCQRLLLKKGNSRKTSTRGGFDG